MVETQMFSGWPSGDCKPILELACTPKEAEAKWNLKFLREKDELDWYLGTHVVDQDIGYIVMMRHENSPSVGTIVYVDSKFPTAQAVNQVRKRFDITDSDIAWEASEI